MENIKITSEIKQNNPKRVAQGKRLAAMSKEAKERKARERLLAEQELNKQDDSSGSSKYIVIGLILVASTGAGAYYVYEKYKSEHKVQSKQQSEQKQPPKKSEQNDQGVKLVDLFD